MSAAILVNKGVRFVFNATLTRNFAPVNLSSATVTFAAKRFPSDATNVFLKTSPAGGIVVTDAAAGRVQITIDAADTEDLEELSLLLFTELKATIDGQTEVALTGTMYVAVETAKDLYISVDDVRAAGLTDTDVFPDATIEAAIRTWQDFIERACRQWFSPREMELRFDGNDANTIFMGVPIIAVSEIRINDDTKALDAQYWRAYTSRSYPDDRKNPRISLIDGSVVRDIYTASFRRGKMVFRRGKQNQYVRGVFGYIEEDGSTPREICRALLKLVIEKVTAPLVQSSTTPPEFTPPLLAGILTEEWTDGHKAKYMHKGGDLKPRAPGLSGVTDDPEILNILRLYRAPIGIATQASPSYF